MRRASMEKGFGSGSAGRKSPGVALAFGLLLLCAGTGPAFAQTSGQRVALDSIRVVAGESKPIQWPLGEARISSIVSVRSSPELAFPIRVDLGSDGGGPLRLLAFSHK